MNAETIKEKLLELNSDVPDFSVTLTDGKPKKKGLLGFYVFGTKEIILYTSVHPTEMFLMYTAIHEFAHHVHATGKNPPGKIHHNNMFRAIMHKLLKTAEEKGSYENVLTTDEVFVDLTEKIRRDAITASGRLMKELGNTLLANFNKLTKSGDYFSDFVQRNLQMTVPQAKLLMEIAALEIPDELGYENMKLIARISDAKIRHEAILDFLNGCSVDTVKENIKAKQEEGKGEEEGGEGEGEEEEGEEDVADIIKQAMTAKQCLENIAKALVPSLQEELPQEDVLAFEHILESCFISAEKSYMTTTDFIAESSG